MHDIVRVPLLSSVQNIRSKGPCCTWPCYALWSRNRTCLPNHLEPRVSEMPRKWPDVNKLANVLGVWATHLERLYPQSHLKLNNVRLS